MKFLLVILLYGLYGKGTTVSATCPYGFRHFFSHGRPGTGINDPYHPSCYKFVTVPDDWLDARKKCAALGADLVSIETAGEQHHLEHVIRTNPNYQIPALGGIPKWGYWTSAMDKIREGHWNWAATGRSLSYKNWDPGEPNNSGVLGEHCMVLLPALQKYRWNDNRCFEGWYMYICEKKSLRPV